MAVDSKKMDEFLGRFVSDLGAAVHSGMVVIGERLGLYKALAAGPVTAAELAAKTSTDERYVREWLASQAAGGYVAYEMARQLKAQGQQTSSVLPKNRPLPWPMKTARRTCPARSNLPWDPWLQFRALPSRSARGLVWVGSNTRTACFMDARNSFVRVMRQT